MSNSDSDSSQDIDLETYVKKDNLKRVYQLQHVQNWDRFGGARKELFLPEKNPD